MPGRELSRTRRPRRGPVDRRPGKRDDAGTDRPRRFLLRARRGQGTRRRAMVGRAVFHGRNGTEVDVDITTGAAESRSREGARVSCAPPLGSAAGLSPSTPGSGHATARRPRRARDAGPSDAGPPPCRAGAPSTSDTGPRDPRRRRAAQCPRAPGEAPRT